MPNRLAFRTGSLTTDQATALDTLGVAILALNGTTGWDGGSKGEPFGTVVLAAKQAMRRATTYPMADKALDRFMLNGGRETLSQAFRFAHIGWS